MIVLLVRPLVCYLLSVVTNELRLKIHTGTFLCCYQWKQSFPLACTHRRAHGNSSPFPAAYSDLILTQMIDSARNRWMPDFATKHTHLHHLRLHENHVNVTRHMCQFATRTQILHIHPRRSSPDRLSKFHIHPQTTCQLLSSTGTRTHSHEVKVNSVIARGYCIWDNVGDREMKTQTCGGGNREAVVAVNIRGQTGTSWTKEKSG